MEFKALKFEVALGTAKRVETKAGALLAVWAIILAAMATIIAATAKNHVMPITLAIALIVMLPMLALIRIFRQLDNRDIEYAYACRSKMRQKLYNDIVGDLIVKERCYRFAYEVTIALFSFFIISIIIAWFLGNTGLCSDSDWHCVRF